MLVQLATLVGKKQTIWPQLLSLQHTCRCFGNGGVSGSFIGSRYLFLLHFLSLAVGTRAAAVSREDFLLQIAVLQKYLEKSC